MADKHECRSCKAIRAAADCVYMFTYKIEPLFFILSLSRIFTYIKSERDRAEEQRHG